jgi:hypothetical protein
MYRSRGSRILLIAVEIDAIHRARYLNSLPKGVHTTKLKHENK